jgi:hypothetical protein
MMGVVSRLAGWPAGWLCFHRIYLFALFDFDVN